jgi:hypothetical protein
VRCAGGHLRLLSESLVLQALRKRLENCSLFARCFSIAGAAGDIQFLSGIKDTSFRIVLYLKASVETFALKFQSAWTEE